MRCVSVVFLKNVKNVNIANFVPNVKKLRSVVNFASKSLKKTYKK